MLFITSLLVPACFAVDDGMVQYVSIRNESDLFVLKDKCRLDSWSKNTVVSLENDISISKPFDPIPIFSGTFEGNGHVISGLNIKSRTEYAGLFGVLSDKAVVKDLKIAANVVPDDDVLFAGGIAGLNKGIIENCAFTGKVVSNTVSGGIAGKNEGIIRDCINNASLDNNKKKNVDLSIKTLKSHGITGLLEAITSGTLEVSGDSAGGICGINKGVLISCENTGNVGDAKRGKDFNVGGICGMNEGTVYLCTNAGAVYGYKNTGGIAGISVPYLKTDTSGNLLGGAEEQIDQILNIIDDVTYNLDNGTTGITDAISSMATYAGYAMTNVAQLEREISAFGNETIGEANVIKDYANTAVHGVSGITGEISGLGDAANEIVINVSLGVNEFKNVSSQDESSLLDAIAAAAPHFGDALGGTLDVIDEANNITTELDKTIKALDKAGLPEFAKLSPEIDVTVSQLTGNLRALTGQVKSLSSSLNGFEKDLTGDVRSITDLIHDIADEIFDVIYSLDDFSLKKFFSDISSDDIKTDEKMHGIIAGCLNTGCVYGHENTGGIVGIMNVNSVPDIDRSGTAESAVENGFSYKMLKYRDVVHSCRNFGIVTSDGDCTGGICGKQFVGAINKCQSFGSVYSGDGVNTGGICGSAQGLIADCYVKCNVSGSDYVGGVTGRGNDSKFILDASTVMNNKAYVSVASDDIHRGAISGCDSGTLLYNYFVGNNLNGVGEYSVEFSAEPTELDIIYKLDDCPEEFKWSTDKLANAANIPDEARPDSLARTYSLYVIIILMGLLLLIIFMLLRLLKKNPKEKNEKFIKKEYIQPWKD